MTARKSSIRSRSCGAPTNRKWNHADRKRDPNRAGSRAAGHRESQAQGLHAPDFLAQEFARQDMQDFAPSFREGLDATSSSLKLPPVDQPNMMVPLLLTVEEDVPGWDIDPDDPGATTSLAIISMDDEDVLEAENDGSSTSTLLRYGHPADEDPTNLDVVAENAYRFAIDAQSADIGASVTVTISFWSDTAATTFVAARSVEIALTADTWRSLELVVIAPLDAVRATVDVNFAGATTTAHSFFLRRPVFEDAAHFIGGVSSAHAGNPRWELAGSDILAFTEDPDELLQGGLHIRTDFTEPALVISGPETATYTGGFIMLSDGDVYAEGLEVDIVAEDLNLEADEIVLNADLVSGTAPWNSAWGVVGETKVTTPVTGVTGTEADVVSTLTVSTVSGRKLEVTAFISAVVETAGVGGNRFQAAITDESNNHLQEAQGRDGDVANATQGAHVHLVTTFDTTGDTASFKLRLRALSGGGTTYTARAAATAPIVLVVKDIGPTPA